jgi:hypothetical protein
MAGKHRVRDVRDLCEREGLKVLSIVPKNGGHLKATLQADDGRILQIVFANSPSDVRGDLNNRAQLRRLLRKEVA